MLLNSYSQNHISAGLSFSSKNYGMGKKRLDQRTSFHLTSIVCRPLSLKETPFPIVQIQHWSFLVKPQSIYFLHRAITTIHTPYSVLQPFVIVVVILISLCTIYKGGTLNPKLG